MEKEFLAKGQSGRNFELSEVQEPQTDDVMEEDVPSTSESVAASRRSGRLSHPPERYVGIVEEIGDGHILLCESDEPTS